MKKVLLLLIFSYWTHSIKAQIPSAIPETREVVLNTIDTIKKIRIFIVNPTMRAAPNKFYAWYQKQVVLQTQGSWSGKLLQGNYEAFYPNHSLLEQGNYEKGIKIGLWKKWYSNGRLQQQYNWVNGLRHGTFKTYDVNGNLIEKGQYKKGKLHGSLFKTVDQKTTKERYRNGKLLLKKKKKTAAKASKPIPLKQPSKKPLKPKKKKKKEKKKAKPKASPTS